MKRYYWIPSAALFTLVLLLYVQTRLLQSDRGDAAMESTELMPLPASQAEQDELYFTPAGLYSSADIAANANMTATVRFRDFLAQHDADPQPGDPICPVTRTKANPECRWVIGGREYQFCCPPCIDEFVRAAKTDPSQILLPEEYVE